MFVIHASWNAMKSACHQRIFKMQVFMYNFLMLFVSSSIKGISLLHNVKNGKITGYA
jgi:hypothetical protein